jgi:hypothetical protein
MLKVAKGRHLWARRVVWYLHAHRIASGAHVSVRKPSFGDIAPAARFSVIVPVGAYHVRAE